MNHFIKSFLYALLIAFVCVACKQPSPHVAPSQQAVTENASNASIEQAYTNKQSQVQVSGKGIVVKVLADDNQGARHQKFLVKINAEQTLLFAHNIDLAPRVPLQIGDEITFSGEYVYNPKGGVIHWTHHAPQGDHALGWISLNHQTYQ